MGVLWEPEWVGTRNLIGLLGQQTPRVLMPFLRVFPIKTHSQIPQGSAQDPGVQEKGCDPKGSVRLLPCWWESATSASADYKHALRTVRHTVDSSLVRPTSLCFPQLGCVCFHRDNQNGGCCLWFPSKTSKNSVPSHQDISTYRHFTPARPAWPELEGTVRDQAVRASKALRLNWEAALEYFQPELRQGEGVKEAEWPTCSSTTEPAQAGPWTASDQGLLQLAVAASLTGKTGRAPSAERSSLGVLPAQVLLPLPQF